MAGTKKVQDTTNESAYRRLELMQSALNVITNRDLSVECQLEEILKTGCELFDEDVGIISRIEGDLYTVEYVNTEKEKISKGQQFELGKTYCVITLEADKAVSIDDVDDSEWKSHPATETGLKSYIGTPIFLDGRRFGTLNFSSATPKEKPFLAIDLEFLSTLGDWVSKVLSHRRLFNDLNIQATHDSLTGLENRNSFMHRLTSCLVRSERSPNYSFAVMFIDLDKFKPVNDTFGHNAGDAVLANVARVVEQQIRPRDGAARLGGDEFGILMEDISVSKALSAARRVRTALLNPIPFDGNELTVGASIGIAMNGEFSQAHTLLEAADAAMYHAKKNNLGICIIGIDDYISDR